MLNIELPYDSAIPFLGILPRGFQTYVHTKTYTQMFIVTLFIITKKRKQPKCPSIYEWINEVWYIHTIEYYSAI